MIAKKHTKVLASMLKELEADLSSLRQRGLVPVRGTMHSVKAHRAETLRAVLAALGSPVVDPVVAQEGKAS